MTPAEAGQVLALMQANWPRLASNDLAAQVWIDDLIGMESVPALEAYRSLRASETRTPAWATFLEAYQMHKRRLAPPQRALDAGDWVAASEEEKARVHALVQSLSQQLHSNATKQRMPMRVGPRKTSQPRTEPLDLKSRAAERAKQAANADMATYDELYPEVPA